MKMDAKSSRYQVAVDEVVEHAMSLAAVAALLKASDPAILEKMSADGDELLPCLGALVARLSDGLFQTVDHLKA